MYVFCCLFVIHWDRLTIHPKSALTALTFTYNYAQLAFHQRAPALDHIWSLCVEEHSYLLLGALALAARRLRFGVMPVLVTGAIVTMADGLVSRLVLHQEFFDVYWRTDVHAGSIFASGALYLWAVSLGHRFSKAIGLSSIAAAIGGVTVFAMNTPAELWFSAGTLLLAYSVATIDRAPAAVKATLSLRPLTWLGLVSFSVYLWQQLFYQGSLDAPTWMRVGLLAVAVLVGTISYYLIETPARRFVNQRFAS